MSCRSRAFASRLEHFSRVRTLKLQRRSERAMNKLEPEAKHPGHRGGMSMSYGSFAAMIATSTIVMFGLM